MIARIFRTKLERIVFIIFSLALSNSMLSAQTIDDKVIITHRSDTYTFFEKDGKMKVRLLVLVVKPNTRALPPKAFFSMVPKYVIS